MDLKAVREAAIEATTRSFWDRNGFVPDEDSEEWEEEYRRQFEQAKKSTAEGRAEVKPRAPVTPAASEEDGWVELTGAPTQIRWAAALRRYPAVAHWLDAELDMLKPRVLIPVGQLAIARFLGAGRLEDRVGRRFGARPVIVPLPHPSGQSRWLNDDANRNRLSHALALIRELREQFVHTHTR